MPPSKSTVPSGHRRLEGSELKPSPGAELLHAADAADVLKVTIVLRRRADGPAVPDHAY